MKRRTLLSGAIGTIVALTASARAMLTQTHSQKPNEAIDPCDALKKVYDEFLSLEGTPELKFKEQYLTASSFSHIWCKRISCSDDARNLRDTWLILTDSEMNDPEYYSREVGLKVVQILSKPAHDALNLSGPEAKEYDVEMELRNNTHPRTEGFLVHVSIKGPTNLPMRKAVQTRSLCKFEKDLFGFKNEPEMLALSRFFCLVTR